MKTEELTHDSSTFGRRVLETGEAVMGGVVRAVGVLCMLLGVIGIIPAIDYAMHADRNPSDRFVIIGLTLFCLMAGSILLFIGRSRTDSK